MNEMQFLTWVRGPGLDIAVGIFLLGVIWRLLEIYSWAARRTWPSRDTLPAHPAFTRCSGVPCRPRAWAW